MTSSSAHTEVPASTATPRERLVVAAMVSDHRRQVVGIPTALLEAGEGPPIVFVQGEFGPIWWRVIPDLLATHRVIAPDLPGLGASELPAGRVDRDTVLDWLGDLVEQTCTQPPVLVGKGPGGAIAARFAARHSDHLAGLVLVDSLGLAPFRPPPGLALTFLRVLLRPSEQNLERGFRNYCFVDLDGRRSDMGETYQAMVDYSVDCFRTPRVRTATRRLARAFGPPIPQAELERISVPTSLIWGRHDLGVPLAVAQAAGNRYGWPLRVIEDARDDPALEQPAAFLDALRAALIGSRAGRSAAPDGPGHTEA